MTLADSVGLTSKGASREATNSSTASIPENFAMRGWPNLPIRKGLEQLDGDVLEHVRSSLRSLSMRRVSTLGVDFSTVSTMTQRPTSHVLRPESRLRIAFDLCSLVVLASELTVIPFIMTFSVPSDEGYFRSLTWFTAIFWTVDLLMAIHTGFHDCELTWRKISKHFRSSWLLVDSGILVCDWVSILLTFSEDARLLKLLRFAKLSRVFRLVGMLRMAKMLQIYEESSRFASGAILAVIRFLGMVFLFLWVNHCLSCVFYLFGKLEETDTGGDLARHNNRNRWRAGDVS